MNEPPRTNPHELGATSADATDCRRAPRPLGLLIVTTLEAVVTVTAAACAPVVLRQFRELFVGFGANLSPLSRFVVDAWYVWWVFALASVIIAAQVYRLPMMTEAERRKLSLAWRLNTSLIGVALGVSVYALYYPIFRLGQVV